MTKFERLNDFIADMEIAITEAKLENGGKLDKEFAHNKAEELEQLGAEFFTSYQEDDKITRDLLNKIDSIQDYLKYYSTFDLISFLHIDIRELSELK